MRALRQGGRLIYSTCSLEPEENESVVDEALEQEKVFASSPGETKSEPWRHEGTLNPGTADRLFPNNAPDDYLRTFPGLYPGDGFFAACLIRAE